MSTTPPTPLSYDVFVSDGPARADDERIPDAFPRAWSPLSSTLIFGAQDALLACACRARALNVLEHVLDEPG